MTRIGAVLPRDNLQSPSASCDCWGKWLAKVWPCARSPPYFA